MAIRFNRKYGRTLGVIALSIIVIFLFITTHAVYSNVSNRQSNINHPITSDSIQNNIHATIKKIEPSSDGNLDIVISINMKDIASYLNWFSGEGEATRNNLPATVNVVMHNPKICESRPQLRWLFYVHSAPDNQVKRHNIRATWGSSAHHAPGTTILVFIVGSVDDPGVQRALLEEQQTHGDIVQGDFTDAYKNLTLKAIFGLKWIATYCKNAEFSLKADDDAFVNVFEWMRLAETKAADDYHRFIMCPLWKDNTMPILRDPSKCMKWCVKYSEFPGRQYFPQYCAGLAVLMTREIVAELYTAAIKTPFFWIDDVFLTGIVSAKLKGVHYVDMMSSFTLKEALASENYLDTKSPVRYHVAHVKNFATFRTMWRVLLARRDSRQHIPNAADPPTSRPFFPPRT
ncbi:hypothetical protein NP493_1080g00035 [Ridgeia piscesae]|uniref:Hexosyltransferase n=1 Tax=Ridgeia piscesae TaxID=27915 RepID=A0AAD9NII1_RIDPI|nr:hypothetical protein NP493_1080g00035 [Ridgeia piscesae]